MARMKTVTISIALLGMCTFASAGSLRSAITSSHGKIQRAMKNRDTAAFTKAFRPVTTKDFKYVEDGKTMSFDEMVKNMDMGFKSMSSVTSSDSKIVSVKETGKTGVAMMTHKMKGMMTGPDKKPHTMEFGGSSRDSYVKVHGKWMMTKMEWTATDMKMDGKKVDPSKMGGG